MQLLAHSVTRLSGCSHGSMLWSSTYMLPLTSAGRTHYDVLSVPTSASEAEIKKAFRALALQLHPDVNREAGAQVQLDKTWLAMAEPVSCAAVAVLHVNKHMAQAGADRHRQAQAGAGRHRQQQMGCTA